MKRKTMTRHPSKQTLKKIYAHCLAPITLWMAGFRMDVISNEVDDAIATQLPAKVTKRRTRWLFGKQSTLTFLRPVECEVFTPYYAGSPLL